MNPSNASSAPDSARTSTSAPTDRTSSPDNSRASSKADEKLDESEFLKEQAEAAKAALAAAFSDLKSDLARGADPRIWIKSHPWITLASAAVAGFAATATVVPSREQQARHKAEAMERALHRARTGDAPGNGNGSEKHRGFIAMILHELFQAIKPAIISLITTHVAPPRAETREDGEHPQHPNSAS